MIRLDPRGLPNRALLVGVSEYDLTEPPHGVPGDLPAVKHNVNRLREVLSHGRVFGEHEITVARSPSLEHFERALLSAAAEAKGVLLLYFAGHGAIPSAGDELFLQMRNASVVAGGHAVFPGAEPFTTVLTMLATSPARRIVVILDCCFAGNAAWVRETLSDKHRLLLMMSVQANHRIDAGDPRTPTPYTAELVRLLDEEGGTGFLDLAERMRERMAARGLSTVRGDAWEPQWRAEPGEDVLLAAKPRAPERETPESPAEHPAESSPEKHPGAAPDPRPDPHPKRTGADPDTPVPAPVPVPDAAGPPRAPRSVRFLDRPLDRLRGLPGKDPTGRRTGGTGRTGRWGRWGRWGHWGRRGRWGTPWTVLLLGLLSLGLLAAGTYGVIGLVGHLRGGDTATGCVPPLELRVLTDPDLEPTIRAAADAHLTSAANTLDNGCRRAGITVYSAGSSDVVTALRKQTEAWREPHDVDTARFNPQRDVGPQPDIWIPASRADVARVVEGQDTDAVAVPEAADEPLAYSPVVLAVPQAIAAEDLEGRTGLPLTRMIEQLSERDEKAAVRRPDPEFTDAGLLATIGLYGSDVPVGTAERLVAQQGPPSPTAAELLCTLPDKEEVDDHTAALVPEFLMRSGVGCDSTTRTPRMAQYPMDVPGMAPVFVRVRWQGADRDEEARDASAAAFQDWLTGEQGEAVFAEEGFRRPYEWELMDRDTEVDGVLAAPSVLERFAGRDAMEAALKKYKEAGGPGRVLYLLDSSGSMTDLWEGPGGGPGLLKQSLGGLGGRDEYGVWAVADTGGRPYETLLPLDSHRRADAERTLDARARVRDAEADPRDALGDAFDTLEPSGTDSRPRMIVYITDGEDSDQLSRDHLDDILSGARTSDVPVTVVSLTNGGCDPDRPDRRIADVSGGRCLDSGDDPGTALRDEVARTGTGEE
ncbi:vWA domain-containing protein [Streptomyces sp. NEAU-W12]|uniref:vWA domain-containing protein n=1 Tax=Streptomyces sp. NEAU-W12 TaxID=2994668 RepID=UPI00224B95FC|nr:caspase family protein [Streptomyces sp. NEAU-W12]MCX2922116.1 substrate-binding domain-containing protein [Streptomyces sp. NEAU-W12]